MSSSGRVCQTHSDYEVLNSGYCPEGDLRSCRFVARRSIKATAPAASPRDDGPLRDLSDERRAMKTWLPQSDKDVSEGRVVLRNGSPHCVKHGAMNKLEAAGHIWRCSCGVGCEFFPPASPEQSEPVGEAAIDALISDYAAARQALGAYQESKRTAEGDRVFQHGAELRERLTATIRATLHRVEEERDALAAAEGRAVRDFLNATRLVAADGERIANLAEAIQSLLLERQRTLSAYASLKRDVEASPKMEALVPYGIANPPQQSGTWLDYRSLLELLARHDPSVSLSEPPRPSEGETANG